MVSKSKKMALGYWCAGMHKYEHKRAQLVSESFIRPAYKYMIAECQDKTQEQLHEYDYLK